MALTSELAVPMRLAREQLGGDADAAELDAIFAGLERRAHDALLAQRIESGHHQLERTVEVRFIRQTKALSVPFHGSPTRLIEDFLRIYAQRYGETAVPELPGSSWSRSSSPRAGNYAPNARPDAVRAPRSLGCPPRRPPGV